MTVFSKMPILRSDPALSDSEKPVAGSDYSAKFAKIKAQTLFARLTDIEQQVVGEIALENRFTLQELKQFVETAIDFMVWNEESLIASWKQWRLASDLEGREFKKWAFGRLAAQKRELTEKAIEYADGLDYDRSFRTKKIRVVEESPGIKIFGRCPVYSEKTRCCNLHTIDAVRNCGFGCTYCSIQTMYTDEDILIDPHFGAKLDAIELDSTRRYHIGTGQSSDALMWGNVNGILDDMLRFAWHWPNALIEFKTKSKNVAYMLERDVPKNVVCSWSLNPDLVIRHEEHLTPDLPSRLGAARAVADRGIGVAFHLHPMIEYKGWRKDYSALIAAVLDGFESHEIVFISFGSLTFPKPIIQKIRTYGINSKINQMPMVQNPEHKMTYPDEVKVRLFRHAYDAFEPWHAQVFFYLCMEQENIWKKIFGKAYPDNQAFEQQLLDSAWEKLRLKNR